jgi:hypothetical protein
LGRKRTYYPVRPNYPKVEPLEIERTPLTAEIEIEIQKKLERAGRVKELLKKMAERPPPPKITIRPEPLPGQPRGILLNPNRWTQYEKRDIPPKLGPRMVMERLNQELTAIRKRIPDAFITKNPIRYSWKKDTFNAHFVPEVLTPKQAYFKRKVFIQERGMVVEIGLGNGLGSRFRMHQRPENQPFLRNFVMQCVSRILWGHKYGAYCVRRRAVDHVVRHWKKNKWAVKNSFIFNSQFFRDYDPDSLDPAHHADAQFMFKAINHEYIVECRLVELVAACKVYKLNLTVLELQVLI